MFKMLACAAFFALAPMTNEVLAQQAGSLAQVIDSSEYVHPLDKQLTWEKRFGRVGLLYQNNIEPMSWSSWIPVPIFTILWHLSNHWDVANEYDFTIFPDSLDNMNCAGKREIIKNIKKKMMADRNRYDLFPDDKPGDILLCKKAANAFYFLMDFWWILSVEDIIVLPADHNTTVSFQTSMGSLIDTRCLTPELLNALFGPNATKDNVRDFKDEWERLSNSQIQTAFEKAGMTIRFVENNNKIREKFLALKNSNLEVYNKIVNTYNSGFYEGFYEDRYENISASDFNANAEPFDLKDVFDIISSTLTYTCSDGVGVYYDYSSEVSNLLKEALLSQSQSQWDDVTVCGVSSEALSDALITWQNDVNELDYPTNTEAVLRFQTKPLYKEIENFCFDSNSGGSESIDQEVSVTVTVTPPATLTLSLSGGVSITQATVTMVGGTNSTVVSWNQTNSIDIYSAIQNDWMYVVNISYKDEGGGDQILDITITVINNWIRVTSN